MAWAGGGVLALADAVGAPVVAADSDRLTATQSEVAVAGVAIGTGYLGNLAAGSAFGSGDRVEGGEWSACRKWGASGEWWRETRSPPSAASNASRKSLRLAWQTTLGRG